MSDHIILISCSNGKVRGGNGAYNVSNSITAMLAPDIQQQLLERRRRIAGLIMAGQVEDRLRGDGNRRDSRYNMELQLGPDMGVFGSTECPAGKQPDITSVSGTTTSLQYLPAYQRYDGRFFAHAGVEAFEMAILEECHVLIVSGLYGLLLPEELIQAYNCHLDDDVLNNPEDPARTAAGAANRDAGDRISGIWQQDRFPDRLLQTFIQSHNRSNDHAIRYVMDLLSEISYQRLFNWGELYDWFKRNGISWFHRMVQGVREPAFLSDLGRFFRHEVVDAGFRVPKPGKVVRDYLHTIHQSGGHLEFTKEIRPDPYTDNLLRKELGDFTWHHLERQTREDLIHGELFFQLYDARSSKQSDEVAPRIVHFFSALENELHPICQHKAGKSSSLGGYIYHLCEGALREIWKDDGQREAVCTELARLLPLRNRMSHRGLVVREDLLAARNAILRREGLLSVLVALKLAHSS